MKAHLVQAGCWLLIAVILAAGGWGVWLFGDTFMPAENPGLVGTALYAGALAGAAILMWSRRAKPAVQHAPAASRTSVRAQGEACEGEGSEG